VTREATPKDNFALVDIRLKVRYIKFVLSLYFFHSEGPFTSLAKADVPEGEAETRSAELASKEFFLHPSLSSRDY
jgi:hypothetical protein